MAETVLEQIRDHLIAEGIVRKPSDAGAGARPWLPPMWRHPPDGTPAPGSKVGNQGRETDDGLVLALYLSGEIAPGPGEGYSNRLTFDVDFRSKKMDAIEEAAEQIRDVFAPAGGGGVAGIRWDWTLASVPPLHVIESRLWRGLQILSQSNAEGYHFRLSILLEIYR